jgi:tetratricopeptide (TPR) repeat protein
MIGAMWRWLVVVCCLASALHAQPDGSAADPKQAQAEALYAEGAKDYSAREYAEAIDAFKRAYELFPEPTFLFDIAQAYRLLKDCDNAAAFYRNYLLAKPDAPDRGKAEKLVGEMDTCAADLHKHRDAGRAQPLAVAAPAAAAGPRYRGLRLAGFITAGAGLVLAGAGVYFSIDAADKANQLEQACMTSCRAIDVSAIDSAGKSSEQSATTMYIAGTAALAAGAGMIVWATLHASPETVIVTPAPGGATVSTTIRF